MSGACAAARAERAGERRRHAGGLPAAGRGACARPGECRMAGSGRVAGQRMEMVGRFAAGIAHDFNNLLAVVLAAAEQIAGRPGVDEATREDAAQIRAAARRGAALVRHLLGLRPRNPRRPPPACDLREAVDDLAPLLRHLLGRGVRLEIDAGTAALPVRIDPTGVRPGGAEPRRQCARRHAARAAC